MFKSVIAAAAVAAIALPIAVPAHAEAATLLRSPIERNTSRTNPVIRSASTQTKIAKFLTLIGAHYAGPARGNGMTIDVQTPMRNASALSAYAQAASNPRSTYYRKFLTPSQIADNFGSTPAQYAQSVAYFQKYGLAVKQWKTRSFITVAGELPNVERAFNTNFGTFQSRNRATGMISSFVAPTSDIKMDASIGVPNLRSFVTAKIRTTHDFIGGPAVPISGSFSNARVNGATPYELGKAYDYQTAYDDGFTGQGVNLGIIGTGPITTGTSAANDDIYNYRKTFNVPGKSTVTQVDTTTATVSGDASPPPVTAPCTGSLPTCNPEDEEAQLDTEQTSMLAYNANILFYLAYEPSGPSIGIDASDDELMQAIDDNQTDILSLSYGGCETLDATLGGITPNPGGDATGTDPTLFQELATEGIAVFVSSGDTGSAGCQRATGNLDTPSASYPASDPNVVSVGGTTTPMLPTGVLSGPITGWGSQTQSGGAEGSGQSGFFNSPSFQQNVDNVAAICTTAATLSGATQLPGPGRCQPDVVLDADPFTGAAVIYNTGITGVTGATSEEAPIGGTSQAAPDMAAMWAVVLSACEVTPKCGGGSSGNVVDPPGYKATNAPAHTFRLGNPNFLWYPLAASTMTTAYHNTFYDIVFGDDGVPPYSVQLVSAEAGDEGANISAYAAGVDPGSTQAGPGYDIVTGMGAPFARNLIRAIVGV